MESNQNAPSLINSLPWKRILIIGLSILVWFGVIWATFAFIGLLAYPLLLIGLSMVIAYLLYPLMKVMKKKMPRLLALAIIYIVLFVFITFIATLLVLTTAAQIIQLVEHFQQELPNLMKQVQPLLDQLSGWGISINQLQGATQQILANSLNLVNLLVPFASGVMTVLISGVIVTTMSMYFMLDGERMLTWLRDELPEPYSSRAGRFLDILDHVMGSFLRGQLLAASITTVITGVGLWLFQVPYALLLTMIIFLFEFIPQIGSYISVTIVSLIALVTAGWEKALLVLAFCTFVQGVIGGQVVQPRVIGGAVGLHPIFSLVALLIGAALFGLVGAILAVPIAGILQTFVVAAYKSWRENHPQHFHHTEQQPS